MNHISINPNSNFNSLAGSNQPDNISEEYLIYRRAWEENPRNFILHDLPLDLDIEASSVCNLRCTFCDKQLFVQDEQMGKMSFDTFKHILDQFSPKKGKRLWGMKLSYRGEPLTNKEIPKMVKYAKDRGVLDIYFNTNGMLLTEDVSRDLIEAHLDRISISIDGTNAEEYEKVRIGANFDTVVSNIKRLRELREEYGVTYPKIRIQTVKLPELDLEKYVNTWKVYADEVAALEYTDESVRVTDIEEKWACPQLWQRMTIEWDGYVYGCNNDDLKGICLGNALERTIYDCWHDERLMEIRKCHMKGKSHEVNDCNGCPWRTAQIKKEQNKSNEEKGYVDQKRN
ncbi:MAG: radical SAM protein [Dorea sp.]|nr:radical SAM protein [Dorea sp.]